MKINYDNIVLNVIYSIDRLGIYEKNHYEIYKKIQTYFVLSDKYYTNTQYIYMSLSLIIIESMDQVIKYNAIEDILDIIQFWVGKNKDIIIKKI